MVSKNLDLEFASLQPCFYPDEDDFYVCSPDSAFPGEDIWKKFALLPTCPPAPSGAGLQEDPPGRAPVPWGEVALGGFGTHDPLDWKSKVLLLPTEADLWGSTDGGDLYKTVFGDSTSPKSIVLQDCMWNAFAAHKKLERAVSGKRQGTVGVAKSAVTAGTSITTASPLAPAEVFPFPSNKRETVTPAPATGGLVDIRVNISGNSWIAQQAAAAIQHSDHHASATSSSGDDDLRKSVCISKDKEEEDEVQEINVVAVEKRCSSSSKAVTTLTITMHPKNATLASVSSQQDELIPKPCASIHQQRNYATPSPCNKSNDTLQQKKLKNEVPHPKKPVIQPKSKNSSPQNADSEESNHRSYQNSLERQRNKDLRDRLFTLSGYVPELVQKKKAPKILILKKAIDYIHSLEAEEQKLLLEKEKLQARQQELLKELEHTGNC